MKTIILILTLLTGVIYSNQADIDPELALYLQKGQSIQSPFNGLLIEQEFYRNELLIPSQRYWYLKEQYGIQSEMIDAMRSDYNTWQKEKKQLEFNNNLMFGLAIGGVTIGIGGVCFGILKGFKII
jgi:hypothetical protein